MATLSNKGKGRIRALAEALAAVASRYVAPRACAIAGACAGLFAGWFVAGAGLVIGGMLDIARGEARSRALIAAFLDRPDSGAPPEPLQGYAAAACLALKGEWPSLGDPESKRALLERFSDEALPRSGRERREAERIIEVAARAAWPNLPALARHLASVEDAGARELLARWAFALAALGGARLGAGPELSLRAILGDCGLRARELLEARLAAFPGERDPWTVLGLGPGAPRAEVKRAYRRLSKLLHPDAPRSGTPGAADGGERFRELQAAYAELTRARP